MSWTQLNELASHLEWDVNIESIDFFETGNYVTFHLKNRNGSRRINLSVKLSKKDHIYTIHPKSFKGCNSVGVDIIHVVMMLKTLSNYPSIKVDALRQKEAKYKIEGIFVDEWM